MNFPGERPVRIGFWAILLLGLLAWAPATYPGYWQALEGFIPVFNVVQSGPIASVATTPDLWHGTGSATFILAQPFLLLGLSPTAAVRALFILCFILGSLGIYIWLEPRLGDRSAGLAGLVYAFSPVFLSTVYIRGSLSDALMLALFPLALAAAAVYAASSAPAVAGLLVIAVVWLWRVQAGLALWATVILLLYALVVERHRLTALVVAVAGAAGLVSLAPLWSIRGDNGIVFTEHFVHFFQLFGHQWQVAPSVVGWQDGYPFQIGLTTLAFSTVAFWLWRRKRHRTMEIDRLLWFSYGVGLGLIVLSLTISAPLWRFTQAGRVLTYPWQVLLLALPFLTVTAGSLAGMNQSLARVPQWAVLTALIVLAGYPTLTTEFTQLQPPTRPQAMLGDRNNLAILDAVLSEDAATATATLAITWQALQPLDADYNVFFQAIQPGGDSPQVIAQLDVQPLDGAMPASTWQPGSIHTDTYVLDLPQDAGSPEPLRYYFGFYDWRDGTRLPVDGGIDDKLVFHGR